MWKTIFQSFSFLALLIIKAWECLKDLVEDGEIISKLNIYNAVCGTCPFTPGLLNSKPTSCFDQFVPMCRSSSRVTLIMNPLLTIESIRRLSGVYWTARPDD